MNLFRMQSVILAILFVFLLESCGLTPPISSKRESNGNPVGSTAEWQTAEWALVHNPGEELFLGVLNPDAALFEYSFDIEQASAEHRNYIEHLKNHGIRVTSIVEVLLDGTLNEKNIPMEGKKLDELRNLANDFITIDAAALPLETQQRQKEALQTALKIIPPRQLVKVILNQPTIHLQHTDINTFISASYELAPLMNLLFLRDQLITTQKGVVVGKMNSIQRGKETELIRFVLKKMGVNPLYEIEGEGRLEGGDFMPLGDVSILAEGLRTNQEGIRQLVEHDVFGTSTLIVVKDNWRNQQQMHLDTYFNVLNETTAVLAENRYSLPEGFDEMRLLADVYERQQGVYAKKYENIDFQRYMENNHNMKFISVSSKDQKKYGINFLTIAPNRIIGVDGVSDEYKNLLVKNKIDAEWIDFKNLSGGYGAAHCTVQVLRRKAN